MQNWKIWKKLPPWKTWILPIVVDCTALLVVLYVWQSQSPFWSKVKTPEVLPNWILCFGTLFGIAIAIGTLRAIRIQTNIARDNVEIIVSKERARLRIELLPLQYDWPKDSLIGPTVIFIVRYYGATEAFIGASEVCCEIFDTEELRPGNVNAIVDLPSVVTKDTPLTRQGALIWPALGGDVLQKVKCGHLFVHFYGFVRYTDVFDRQHETGWYYTWKVEHHPHFPDITHNRWVKRKCRGYDREF